MGRININNIAPSGADEKERFVIEKLWKQFLHYYYLYKDKEISKKDKFKYSFLCVPGPSQYQAFFVFFKFFKDEEYVVESLDSNKY